MTGPNREKQIANAQESMTVHAKAEMQRFPAKAVTEAMRRVADALEGKSMDDIAEARA